MNNFLRAQLRLLQDKSIRLLGWSYVGVVCSLLVVASALVPVRSYAAVGFSGGTVAPSASAPGLICSGSAGTFTFTPSTCSLPVGADWTADYVVDSFNAILATWVTPVMGTNAGSITAASPLVIYTTPVLTSTTCYEVRYRVSLSNITQHCIPGNTTFSSSDVVFNVCPQPAPVTGGTAVCVGDTIHLNTTSTGGTWSVNPPGFANISTSGVLTGVLAGTVTVSYSFSGGCAATHIVTVFATPAAITGPTVVCLGTTAGYTLASGPFVGTWSSSDPTVGTISATTGVYTASATNTGTSTITFTNPGGCFSSLTITVNPFPNAIGCLPGGMCYGNDTATLCSTTPGGTWSVTNGIITVLNATTGVITPTSPTSGIDTVRYTVMGCTVTATVSATAAPTAIGGPSTVCEGATITLTGTPAGGTWSVDPASAAIFSVNPATGVVLALAGSGGLTGDIVYHLGSCTLSKTVSVNIAPSPIVGGPALCISQTVTFTSTPAGGLWSMSPTGAYPAGMGSISVFGGVYTPPGIGTATISYTLPGTGCRTTKVVTVGVTPDPITGPTLVCQNSSINLCSATFGGDWGTIPGGTGAATVSPTFATCTNVTGTAPGTVIVTYSLGASGCMVSKIITVNPAPTAIMGPDYICQGLTANYTSTPAFGAWTATAPNVTITTATGIATGVSNGTSIITYTLPNMCSATKIVTVATTPAPITGVLGICVGQTTSLSSTPIGGTWMGTDTSIAFVDTLTGIVTGRSPGAVIVTRTLQPQGCTAIAVVTVNPLPDPIVGPTSVCRFHTVTLTNPSGGGTWSSSLTSRATIDPVTGVVTGILPGTTTIAYTFTSTGCSRTMVFTVNPNPTDIFGTLDVCVGSTTVLNNGLPGGTWMSGSPLIADVNSITGVVTGIVAGTANITYTLSTGCDTFTTVTVNPLPATITGGLRTCIGSCNTIFSSPSGGTWSSADVSIATIHPSLGTLCGVSTGTVFITYTLPTGCIRVAVATVDPTPPPPTGNTSICVGSTTTFSHVIPGGTWTSSDTFVAKVFLGTGLITGIGVGTANITYVTPFGCATSLTITVNPVPPAITGTLYMCVNNSTTLSNSLAGGTWQSVNTAVALVGSSTGVVTGIGPDTTTISYIMPTGCAATAVVTVYPLPVISGSVLVCPGVASTLTAAPAGGLWTSSPTSVATIGSLTGVVMGVNAGTVNITYILSSTCLTHITATVQPLPAVITGPTQVCVGSSIQLFNFTGGGGTWTSSNPGRATIGTTTGLVTGISAGTVAITFTANTTGCVISTIITVNPLPAPITGTMVVCAGSTTTLSSTSTGGTWSVIGGHTTIGSTSGVVTGLSAGVDTVTYTLATGCITRATVTVNPLPTPIAGTLHVCHGNAVRIYSGPAGGTWSTGSPLITLTPLLAGSDTATVTGLNPGTAIVTYTLPTGCMDTAVVTVDPLPPPITGTLNLCVNDTVTLFDASPGGTWTSDNIFIAVVYSLTPTTGQLATVSAGTVIVTYTLPTGCFTTTVVTVNPTPQPISGTLTVCQGLSTTLGNITTGGSWSSGNTSVASVGSASGVVTGVSAGTARITYRLPSSCFRTAIVTVNPNPTPISGPLRICQGDTTVPVLTSTPAGGTWSSSHPDTAFIFMPTGQMIGIRAGTSRITYTLSTGCITSSIATIDPIPTNAAIVGSRVVCQGSNATLSVIGFPAGGTWASGNTLVATIGLTSGTYTGVIGGTANITYTSVNGCDTFITVTVNPLPAAIGGVVPVCVGDTITLTSSPAGGTWLSTNTSVGIIGSSSGEFVGVNSGVVTVRYTLPTGCFVTANVVVNPLPNPFTVAPSQLCVGDIDTIVTTSLGGGWSVNSTPPGVLTVTAFSAGFDSARIIASIPGEAIITYSLPTGCFRTHTVTVNDLPSPIVGPDTMCLGSTVILASSPSTGIVGTWSAAPSVKVTLTPFSTAFDSVSVNAIDTGSVLITYMNDNGCITTHTIDIRPLPTAIFGTFSLCEGATVTLMDTSGTGTWSISDTTLISTVATIDPVTGVVTGIVAGTATVTYTLTTGCATTAIITINPIPDVGILSHPVMMCKYASVTLTATGLTDGGYTWAPPTGLSSSVGASVIASPTITTTYTVTGTTAAGCSDTAIVTVIVDSLLNGITITGQDTVCKGGCTQLIANGREGTYFEWKPAVGLSCTICDTVTACPVNTTIYNALAIDSLGCRDSLFFTVTVMPLPQMSVTPNPLIVCNGSSTLATVRDTFASVGYQTKFKWFPNAFISCDTCATTSLSNTFNLVYRIIGTTPFGCIDSIKVPVTVLDSAFNTINDDTVICPGQSAQLYINSVNPDGARSDYQWSSNVPEDRRYIYNPLVTPAVTTTYSVLVTPNVCFPRTLYTTVVVAPAPEFKIDISPSDKVAPGTPVTLTAVNENPNMVISSFAWADPATLSCSVCYKTIATPFVTTTYTFTATSIYGCTSTDVITITVGCENSQVFIPNSFTPNGDGVNDRFFVQAKGISKVTKFLIFGRWGQLVYERYNIDANDAAAGWDGQYKDVMMPPGVYYYVVDATCIQNGTEFTYKGDVTIVK